VYPTYSSYNKRARKNFGVFSLVYSSASSVPTPFSRTRLEGVNDSCPMIVSVALGSAKEAVMFTVSCPSTDWITDDGVIVNDMLPSVIVAETKST